MRHPHHAIRGQSIWLKAVFIILLISAPASSMTGRIAVRNEAGYHCKYKIYPHSVVETTRLVACRGFTSPKFHARRPVIYADYSTVENMIFEWAFPLAVTKDNQGKIRKYTDKITFNNSCELRGLLYYDYATSQFEPCVNVPEVSTSETSGIGQELTEPFIKCGSLSWEITEIQKNAKSKLFETMNSFYEVEHTSMEVDGPWKKISLTKKVIVDGKGKFFKPVSNENSLISFKVQAIEYGVIINNQNEVRSIIIKHYISRKLPVTRRFIREASKQEKSTPIREKKIVTLECPIDKIFPLFPNDGISDLPSPKRQKTSEVV
ncbi:CSEP0388 putative effector protein [Blumeria hordei DH14]|uniref:CSEP0388 putative effector protein n=1 Tax=Blumeria graminis f. sp. hordei (strain DH14) TaxID=546991 RepID=N1JI75_BLUG1|nr:CSEP0388 putative effector protein [Blumeria hordei DH14]